MRIEGRFLSSALARKIFLGVFLFTLATLLAAGTLFYAVADHLSRRAAAEVLSESAKAFSRNFFDRLTSAEVLLRTIDTSSAPHSGSGAIALDDQQRRIFASVIEQSAVTVSTSEDVAHNRTILDVRPGPTDGLPELTLILPRSQGGKIFRATLEPGYLWDSADTALYRLCITTPESGTSCLATANDLMDDPVQVQRTVLFEPFFEARPWSLTATASTELAQILPFHIGFFALAVGLLALLVAMVGTSIYLRRMTSAFDGLIRVTRQAGAGDFGQRVPVETLKDELRELGGSFNSMMEGLQSNFAFRKVLSDIDAAILDRQPLTEVTRMVLAYTQSLMPTANIQLIRTAEMRRTVYALQADGKLRVHAEDLDSGARVHHPEVGISDIDGDKAAFRFEQPDLSSHLEKSVLGLLQDFGKRLAIAAEARRQEHVLSRQATTDSLTGLLNRFGFSNAVKALIRNQDWTGRFEIVFCDLDKFKEVNDAYGHTTGDEVLVVLSSRLTQALVDVPHHAARLGGDEFGFLLPSSAIEQAIVAIRRELSIPVRLGGREALLTASMGAAVYPDHGSTPEELLRKSDLAMYRV